MYNYYALYFNIWHCQGVIVSAIFARYYKWEMRRAGAQ